MMKIRSIQYLRALAALLVVVAHGLLHPIDYVDVTYRRMGSFGVLLFFVISGFIMVYTSGKGPFDGSAFLRRRAERVVPLYWLVTLGVALLAIAAPAFLRNTTFSWAQLAGSLLFIPYARENGELVPLMKLGWTLNYEMFFYLVFAACASLTAGRRVLVVSLLFVVLSLVGAAVSFTAAIPRFYTEELLLTFCVGMGVGLLYLREWRGAASPQAAPLWTAAALVFTVLGFVIPQATPLGPRTDLMFTLAGAAMLLLGLCLEKRMPFSRVGLVLGDASYAMYLTHMYFVAAAIVIVRRFVGTGVPGLEVVSAIVLSVFFAVPIYRLLERPIQRRLRRIGRRGSSKTIT